MYNLIDEIRELYLFDEDNEYLFEDYQDYDCHSDDDEYSYLSQYSLNKLKNAL